MRRLIGFSLLIRRERSLRSSKRGLFLGATLLALLLVGCGGPPTTQIVPTATALPTPCPVATSTTLPTPTATATPSPTAPPAPSPTARPSPTPTATPKPHPTPTPTSACVPPPGVQPVSSVEIDQGNTSRPQIALTFDAGGPATPTAQILNILAKYHLHVTWFVTGQWALDNPELVQRIHAEGHEIGNHTMNHLDLTTLPDARVCQELNQAEQVISGITGQTTRPYFRPPNGARNAHVRALAANLGYRTVYWTIDTIDWREDATPESITERVMNNLSNGVIVLMHAGSTVEAQTLDGLIAKIEQRGYQIVTLTQLLR
jgi:peptidoglycan/xylan/chitin deacetylase (PgdA/CDA1 family)